MKFDTLIDFLQNRMSMSHIYQPLLIKCLVDSGGTSTLRQLAYQFLSQDESQVQYYEDRLKKMPIPVLKKHDVIIRDGELVSLATKKLTLEQKAQIKMICEHKIQEYVVKRGIGIWDYRMLDNNPIPDSLYYRVLKDSGGRCALCGATKKERPLQVDHIKPRSKGGKTVYENLQVLCSKCNQTKSNKDDTGFRNALETDEVSGCRFCFSQIRDRMVDDFDTVLAILDKYPVTYGHHLIIPKRHTEDWFSLSDKERRDSDSLIQIIKNKLSESDETITGFNIGVNCGESAGQTIFHTHIHLIPRRNGDISDPIGGVRGVIPEKMNYRIST